MLLGKRWSLYMSLTACRLLSVVMSSFLDDDEVDEKRRSGRDFNDPPHLKIMSPEKWVLRGCIFQHSFMT